LLSIIITKTPKQKGVVLSAFQTKKNYSSKWVLLIKKVTAIFTKNLFISRLDDYFHKKPFL
jgi:hypothetical protein